jgi:hypothetical protein
VSPAKHDRRAARAAAGLSPRPVGTRELRQRFLIVCEGEKTEPAYFRSFRVPKNVIDVHGIGQNTVGLVREAIRLRDEAAESGHPEDAYDQVWCVFDRDSFPAQNFNAALTLARNEGIQVAYSNEAFELWYLLHYHYRDTAMSRQEYGARLTELLGHAYRKNSDAMYDELFALQVAAMRNAHRLLAQYSPANPVSDNPSTTVHLLVEQLNRFLV